MTKQQPQVQRTQQQNRSRGRSSGLTQGKVNGTAASGNSESKNCCPVEPKGSAGDVLLEHSYCISVSESSSTADSDRERKERNGCYEDQQVLQHQHDDQQQQKSDLINHHKQPELQTQPPERRQKGAEDTDSGHGTEVANRSRRVRRIPAKFMTDEKLFDDIAEFPPPVTPAAAAMAAAAAAERTAVRKKAAIEAKDVKPHQKADSNSDSVLVGTETGPESAVVTEPSDEDEEEEEEDDDDDEDEYKEYCICRKPHGNRFMIACDHCEDWFHGSCIGITKKQSEQYESWVCQTCRDNNPTLGPVRKVPQSTKSDKVPAERKSTQRTTSVTQESSPSSDSGDEKPPRTKGHPPVRRKSAPAVRNRNKEKNGVTEEAEKEDEKEKQRLREVIEKAKREHAEKIKRRERRQGPVDPTMNQLFQVSDNPDANKSTSGRHQPSSAGDTASGHKHIKCVICRRHRVKSDKTIYCSFECIKQHTRTAKKKRRSESEVPAEDPVTYAVFDAFDLTDLPDKERKKDDVPETGLCKFIIHNPGFTLDHKIKVTAVTSTPPAIRKLSFEKSESRKSSVSDGGQTPSTPNTPASTSKHPLKRKSLSEAVTVDNKQTDSKAEDKDKGRISSAEKEKKGRSEDLQSQSVREKVSKAFLSGLEKRLSEADDLTDTEKIRRSNIIPTLVKNIEKSLFHLFQSEGKLIDHGLKNYLAKYRSLDFNLKNIKNRHLMDALFSPKGSEKYISPDEVVRMTPEELARGSDLDAWRKIEAKKSLINSVIVNDEIGVGLKLKKTRKGEEEIQTDVAANEDHFSRNPEPETATDASKALNPLEMILKEIKSSSKSSDRRDDVEDVPKSPVRDETSGSRRTSESVNSPNDAPVTPVKRQRSLTGVDEESKSSRAGVKRIKIAPEITSILSSTLSEMADLSPDAKATVSNSGSGQDWGQRKVLWEGFCSGFEDPTASSSFNPTMSSASRFPLICRTLVNDSDSAMDKLSLPPSLNVVGRIAPEQVASYVQKVVHISGDSSATAVSASSGSESVVELLPLTLKHKDSHLMLTTDFANLTQDVDEDDDECLLFRENFNKFINYLIQRKRYAVVDVKSAAKNKKSNVKDVYLMPFSIPVTTGGEIGGTESWSSQLPSKLMADLFDSSPFTAEVRRLKTKKQIAILLMLLIKKAPSGGSSVPHTSSLRDRSGSASSSSTNSSSTRGSLRRLSSHPQTTATIPVEEKGTDQRSFTPPPPILTVPSVISAAAASAQSSSGTVAEEEEYDPESYIPGLSPDRSSNHLTSENNRSDDDEERLRQKALIQMRLLHRS